MTIDDGKKIECVQSKFNQWALKLDLSISSLLFSVKDYYYDGHDYFLKIISQAACCLLV